jgi:chromosome partitioning protein
MMVKFLRRSKRKVKAHTVTAGASCMSVGAVADASTRPGDEPDAARAVATQVSANLRVASAAHDDRIEVEDAPSFSTGQVSASASAADPGNVIPGQGSESVSRETAPDSFASRSGAPPGCGGRAASVEAEVLRVEHIVDLERTSGQPMQSTDGEAASNSPTAADAAVARDASPEVGVQTADEAVEEGSGSVSINMGNGDAAMPGGAYDPNQSPPWSVAQAAQMWQGQTATPPPAYSVGGPRQGPEQGHSSDFADTPIARAAQVAVEVMGRATEGFPLPEQTRTIVVANQKGGVGKTTTTVNLAAALAISGARVLVVDLDPQGNASTALGIDHHANQPSVYDALVEGTPLAETIRPAADVEGLFCVPATIDLAGAEIELVSLVARESRLHRALDGYHEPMDYVLVDCPPSLGLLTVNALVAGEEVLIPIQCEYYALEGLGQLLRNIELVRGHLNPRLSVSTILLTMYDARTRLASQVADEVRKHFPREVLRTTIPRSVRISEAPSYSQTVMTYDPGSSGALSYLEAAREVAMRGSEVGAALGHENGGAR